MVGHDKEARDDVSILDEAIARITKVERLLVALDFDGTLAPEVDVPADARALPGSVDAIVRLTTLERTSVALVSGRALASLQDVAQVPAKVLMIGSHGVEERRDESGVHNTLTEQERGTVRELGALLNDVVRDFEGVWAEEKPAGFAVHTRLASADDASTAQGRVLARAHERFSGLTIRGGKNLVEFAVRSTTKGDAVEVLRKYSCATAMIYIGDDVTDEDAFAALVDGDVGVKCGPGETAAAYRVATPADVARLLDVLARERARAVA